MAESKKKESFDPAVLLNNNDFFQKTRPGYKEQLHTFRYPLYTLFAHLLPDLANADSLEDRQRSFAEFCDNLTCDMQLSYSIVGCLFHLYFIYWSWSRVLHCPSRSGFSCDTREWTLVDCSGYIQALFYTLSAITIPSIKKYVFCYGTVIMNGSILTTLYYTDSSSRWTLSGGRGLEGYGTWNAVWVPLFMWIFFCYAFRYTIGLAYWLKTTSIVEKIETETPWPDIFMKWGWTITGWLLSATSILIYKCFPSPHILFTPDLSYIPGIFGVFFVSVIVSFQWGIVLGFLTFQHQLVVWESEDTEMRKGIVVMYFDEALSVGLFY